MFFVRMTNFHLCVCLAARLVNKAELKTWLAQGPCKGTTAPRPSGAPPVVPSLYRGLGTVVGRTHASHRIQYRGGVVICNCCGAYGSKRPKLLRQMCLGRTNSGRKAALERWAAGYHPNPGGVGVSLLRLKKPISKSYRIAIDILISLVFFL